MATSACSAINGATVVSEPSWTPQKKIVIANEPAIPAKDINMIDLNPAVVIDLISFLTRIASTIEPKNMA